MQAKWLYVSKTILILYFRSNSQSDCKKEIKPKHKNKNVVEMGWVWTIPKKKQKHEEINHFALGINH